MQNMNQYKNQKDSTKLNMICNMQIIEFEIIMLMQVSFPSPILKIYIVPNV